MALQRRSRILLHWRSDLCSLNALPTKDGAGVAAVFSRAGVSGTVTDSRGTNYTAVNGQPAWHWYDLDANSPDRESPTLYLDDAVDDLIYFPFLALPQVMTVYCRFVEAGTISVSGDRLWQIGAANNAAPRLALHSSGTQYQCTHDNNDGSEVSSTMSGTAPTAGQRVEIRAILNSDGSVQVGQSINEAAETTSTPSGVNTLAAAWSDTRLYLNSIGTTNLGINAFRTLRVIAGVRTMAQCRADW